MKKSYKGLVLWMLIYLAGFFPLIVMRADGNTVTKLTLLYTAVMIAILTYLIYKTDSIYWYNGISYEEAESAGYERRSEYTYRHLQIFGRFAVLFAFFTIASLHFEINIIIDTVVFTVGLIATAISTVKIKL